MLRGERWRRGGDLREAALRVAVVAAWVGAAALAAWAAGYYILGGGVGMDAHAYWLAGRSAHPYGPAPGERDAYLYSPVFAQLISLPARLPWHVFLALVMGVSAGTYWWLLRPLPWRWRVPALLACVPELMITNVSAWVAAALVVGLTRPWALALPGLTKITPAAAPLLWFVVRGEWRKAWVACATTLGLVALSYALAPALWVQWMRFLVDHHGDKGMGFPVRVALSLGVSVYAARKDRRWLVGVAYWLAVPDNDFGPQSAIVLAALVRLVTDRSPSVRRTRSAGSRGPASTVPDREERGGPRPAPAPEAAPR